ncbi:MAG: 7-carboxy-7-deazaguanine synthase QueE [Candidatus Omnitrophica bacterium]|nr:7-carboxy-7-deazaguanine synthase QueE [Candidatus Omnitrophota bacterium]
MKAKISEIFKSIQGEGLHQGTEQIFVRFFGCNMHCSFCDTRLNDYSEKTVEEALKDILSLGVCSFVSLTGGEPLMHADFVKTLASRLKGEGKTVYLETNGIMYENLKEIIGFTDIIAMDFKLPSSTNLISFWHEHENFLKIASAKEVFVKAVIGKDTQVDDIFESIRIIKRVNPDVPFVLQPQNPFEEALREKLIFFSDICQKEHIDVRTMCQLHKILGVK